jgi:hypothetical protein
MPKTLLECFYKDDGTVNVDLYCKYLKYLNKQNEEYTQLMLSIENEEATERSTEVVEDNESITKNAV